MNITLNSTNKMEIDDVSELQMFEWWVDILYYYLVTNGNNTRYLENVDLHFIPQIYNCNLLHLINIYDYIVIYNKHTFVNNVKYILKQVMMANSEVYNDRFEQYFMYNWGDYQNESLFERHLQRHSYSNKNQINLIQKYVNNNRSLLVKLLDIYKDDYQYLPLKPPAWIKNVYNIDIRYKT